MTWTFGTPYLAHYFSIYNIKTDFGVIDEQNG